MTKLDYDASKEIVKYNNKLNDFSFATLNENQMNILFTIFAKMKYANDDNIIEFDVSEILELADIQTRNLEYISTLLSSLKKLQTHTFQYLDENKHELSQNVIFPVITINQKTKKLKIKINAKFKEIYLLDYSSYTRYDLAEFVYLSGTYTKIIYRLLKQFKRTGKLTINYDKFKQFLNIPASYRARDIDKQILQPALKELSKERDLFDTSRIPFRNLKIEKIKSKCKIETLIFTYDNDLADDFIQREASIQINLLNKEVKYIAKLRQLCKQQAHCILLIKNRLQEFYLRELSEHNDKYFLWLEPDRNSLVNKNEILYDYQMPILNQADADIYIKACENYEKDNKRLEKN